MKKEDMEQELYRLTDKVNEMLKQAKLEMSSIKFLEKQTNNLIEQFNDPRISFEEKEIIEKQMDALQQRLLLEKEMVEKNDTLVEEIDERVQFIISELSKE
jgi:hypothetical protein